MNLSGVFTRLYKWRLKHISSRNFVIILSILTGLGGGLAAVTLRKFVEGLHHLLTLNADIEKANYWYFIYPLIGLILTVAFRKYFNRNKLGRGIPNLLYIINKKSGLVPKDEVYSHVATSGLTVGFGGSAGLEAPIVTTGAAIGSNLGRLFHIGYKKRTLLIGCGTAAAIGGIFGAPIAGVIFSLEVLLLELTIPAFIPLLISAVAGTLVSYMFLGDAQLFDFMLTEGFHYKETPYYVVLGILCGLISYYFHKNIQFSRKLIEKVQNQWGRVVLGGVALGIMIFLLPPLYGEGYETINRLLSLEHGQILENSLFFSKYSNEWFLLLIVCALILVKVFATGFTIAGGGNGGVFAPTMFTGALVGFGLSSFLNKIAVLNFGIELSVKNFVMVGMAGVASGLMHAPLTSIFLIAELTGGYELIVPLMIVSALSFATIRYFEKHSHYHFEMAKKGQLHFHDKDKTVLTIMRMDKLIEKEFTEVDVNGTLKELVDAVTVSKRNIFPVIDETRKYHGVVTLDDIRKIMFDSKKYDSVKIKDILHRPIDFVTYSDTMEEVMHKFDKSGYWNLPVLENDKYVGFLSKSKIFNQYRGLLKKETKEDAEIID